jgi:hypothetical protein
MSGDLGVTKCSMLVSAGGSGRELGQALVWIMSKVGKRVPGRDLEGCGCQTRLDLLRRVLNEAHLAVLP